MSHYTKMTIQAQQRFESELLTALKEHFTDVELHEKKDELMTYFDQASGLSAEIIVRKAAQAKKKGVEHLAVNDLGYERNREGGYDLHVDLDGFPVSAQNAVNQRYAELVASHQLEAAGYQVAHENLANGEVKLVAQRWD